MAACSDDGYRSSESAALCNDIYDRTDFCLADIGCQGSVGRGTYVDQCLYDGVSRADRDAFLASSCEEVNAGSCLADSNFYRSNCDCVAYTMCGAGTQCANQVDGDAVCLDDGNVPANAPSCDSGNLCPAGWVCAVPNAQTTTGRCIQFCIP